MKTEFLIRILNLLQVPGMGPHRVRLLVNHFPREEKFESLSTTDLCQIDGFDIKLAKSIKQYFKSGFGEQQIEGLGKLKTSIVSFWDDEYPQLLKKIYDPPVLLYIKGKPLETAMDGVAVVGTRRVTEYGRTVTKRLSSGLAGKGITIVSGLARGVDTEAHKAAVEVGGKTIAVFGSGIDFIYPAENRKLADKILDHGSLISEFPLGTQPDAGNFPQRNRIISGLSHATVVIEAGHRSGAILTALNAVDQNRDLFAAPGRITDQQSKGCNRLIRNGAVPVKDADQIINHIQPRCFHPLEPRQEIIELDISSEERNILNVLSNDPTHIDDLSQLMDMGVSKLLTKLLEMELKGLVRQLAGKQFIRA